MNSAATEYEKALQEIMTSALEGEISEYLETMCYLHTDDDLKAFSEIIKYLTSNEKYSPGKEFDLDLDDSGDFEFSEFNHSVIVNFSGTKDKIDVSCSMHTTGEFSDDVFEDEDDDDNAAFNEATNSYTNRKTTVDSIPEALYFIDVQISYARKNIIQIYDQICKSSQEYHVSDQKLNCLYKEAKGRNFCFIDD